MTERVAIKAQARRIKTRRVAIALLCGLMLCPASRTARAQEEATAPIFAAIGTGELAAVAAVLDKDKAQANATSAQGRTALMTAVSSGQKEIVALLLEKGADPNVDVTNTVAGTALEVALNGFSSGNGREIVLLLIDKGAKLNIADREGRTPLLRAIQDGNRDLIALLLEHGADVEARDRFGQTALGLALSRGNSEAVKLLIEKVDIKGRDAQGRTPLFLALQHNNAEAAKSLLKRGADVNARTFSGDTLLHVAAANAGDLLDSLLSAGAKANARNNRGDTPLHLALRASDPGEAANVRASLASSGSFYSSALYSSALSDSNGGFAEGETPAPREGLLNMLIEKSDINAKDQLGMSPLLLAIAARNPEARAAIIERAPRIDNTTRVFDACAAGDVVTLQKRLAAQPFLAFFRLANGMTPLHVCALWGTRGAAEVLIARGADVRARDAQGRSALHLCASRATGIFAHRARNMAQLLLAKGADVNALDRNDLSPLQGAIRMGDKPLILLLLDKKADPNARERNGQTPLLRVANRARSDLSVAQALISKGADVNAADRWLQTPLMRAVSNRNFDLVRLLLANHAKVDARDNTNRTALARLIDDGASGDSNSGDSNEVIKLLLQNGADPNLRLEWGDPLLIGIVSSGNKDALASILARKDESPKLQIDARTPGGDTALIQAAIYGNKDAIRLLLAAGADPNAQSNAGRTPLKNAMSGGDKEVIELLKAGGATQ